MRSPCRTQDACSTRSVHKPNFIAWGRWSQRTSSVAPVGIYFCVSSKIACSEWPLRNHGVLAFRHSCLQPSSRQQLGQSVSVHSQGVTVDQEGQVGISSRGMCIDGGLKGKRKRVKVNAQQRHNLHPPLSLNKFHVTCCPVNRHAAK